MELYKIFSVFFVENPNILEYNYFKEKQKQNIPGMCETPSYFEPTMTKRDSYIAGKMPGLKSWKAEYLLRLPT